jgi:hypothetical protein
MSTVRRVAGHCTTQCLLILALYVVYTYLIVEVIG